MLTCMNRNAKSLVIAQSPITSAESLHETKSGVGVGFGFEEMMALVEIAD
jgi:hypothetical protein